MNNQKTICIIPARKGSKRLPQKNRRALNSIPLISYSIKYAIKNTELINKIVVTTDDVEIKKIAEQFGVSVIDRPHELSGDKATTVSAIKHVLNEVKQAYDVVIILQPTNPLRPKKLLQEVFHFFKDQNCDSVMTVSRNSDKLGKIKNDKFIPYNYKIGQRSQDLEPLYFENGLLYITKTSVILDDKILGSNNLPFIVEHPYAKVDIDTAKDFEYAEFILKNYPND